MPITTRSKCPQYGHPVTVTEDDNGEHHATGGVVDIPRLPDPEHPDQKPIKGLCPSCGDEINRVLASLP